MPSSVGYGLLHSLILTETPLSTLQDHSITDNSFFGKEKDAYYFIRSFVMEHGQYPQAGTVLRQIGEADAFDGLENEPVLYWIREVKERKRFDDIRISMTTMREHLDQGNVSNAISTMGSSYISLRDSYEEQRMVTLRDVQGEVIEAHDAAQNNVDIMGIPFGFPFIDSISGGAQPGDYCIVVGETGVGKSYLVLRMGQSAYFAGKKVLIVSTEMPNLQAARRVLAMEGRFSTTDLKMGRLSAFGRARARQIIDQGALFEEEAGNYFLLLPGGMFSNVEDIIIVAKENRPDLLIIDGAYLLQCEGQKSWWEKNMKIASMLKNLALVEQIPVTTTYQYNKTQKGKLEGVGGGFAIPQIASIVFSFEFERKEDIGSITEVQYRLLNLIKGRDGESGKIRVEYNMRRTTLEQNRVLSGRVDPDERASRPPDERELDTNPVEEI